LLPRVINYNVGGVLPSLTVAQRLYPDAMLNTDRSDELRLENKIIHPAFMRPTGICLSN